MKQSKNMHLLEKYIPIADMIVENFGKYCETVIHDFDTMNSSIVYIKGNVTERMIGAPITNVILQQLKKYGDESEDMTGFTSKTKDGKVIKTSISFIRNNDKNIIGCIGINFNTTAFTTVSQIINDFSMTSDLDNNEPELELYENDMKEIFESMIEMTLDSTVNSVENMKREEKRLIVNRLDKKGVFLMQGSIEKISEILDVSKQTVYNYLDRD